ncbi:hypothetical protein IE53DRAFT_372711 [Violaceomyces palustris]|uniref:Uncharacterized protein n=1 Tax=Violaceomyces palustris TaxID=1673888 RepID=A0ACD0P7P9_9BASI|nr:hypothetical protein IE53DRAFT_372711 [Violaceomyces palustris]
MVDDPKTDELIRWSPDGASFFVPNHVRFGDEVLPRFFKHNRFSSFVRQLNMYGFHKVPHLQQGALKHDLPTENELWEFTNPNFHRDKPELLAKSGGLQLSSVLSAIHAIKNAQSSISADLRHLQNSNQGLWQEAIESRQRSKRQQETINKILRFLAGVEGG